MNDLLESGLGADLGPFVLIFVRGVACHYHLQFVMFSLVCVVCGYLRVPESDKRHGP